MPLKKIFSSFRYSLFRNDGRLDIIDLINGILGSLVSVTAGCYLYKAWEAILIGIIGAILACITIPLFDRMGVDDPVGASSVHGVCGVWGVLALGLFADNPIPLGTTNGRSGLFKGGGWYLLGVQSLTVLCLLCWGLCSTFLLLWIINKIVPIRMEVNEELLGADLMEHRIRHQSIELSRAISALAPLQIDISELAGVPKIGINPGHERSLEELRAAEHKLNQWRAYMDLNSPQRTNRRNSGSASTTAMEEGRRSAGDNVLTRKFRSMKARVNRSNKPDNFIVTDSYKKNNSELPSVSNRVEDSHKGETNFAWID